MRIKKVKDKQGDRYSLEIFQGKDEIKNEYQRIEREITPIVKKIGINAGDYIHHWIGNADTVFLISQNKKTLGFLTAMYYSDQIIYIPILMLDPDIQKKGIMSILSKFAIKNYFIWRIKQCKYNPFIFLFPIYIIFRTENPTLYKILQSKINVYPRPDGTLPKLKHEIRMVLDFVKNIWPNSIFDEKKFILKNEFNDQSDFFKNGIPWSRNKEVDEFMEKRLNLTKFEGNALVVLVKINLKSMLKF